LIIVKVVGIIINDPEILTVIAILLFIACIVVRIIIEILEGA